MKTLGKFEIIEKLGQGAMGVVYKARDPLIGRQVALKTITTGLAEDPSLLERFYHEAHSAGALQHPNIVTIFELGEADNTPFIAMEYLAGQSLDKMIETRQQLPLSQKVGYVVYVCRALGYAHKQGVVHRDVKPANVMVTADGTVKVVDFGIARIAENSKSQTGLIIGTLGYMSPQQIEGGRADARSDIWATGVLFYELLAYHRPFDGENYGALMLNVMTRDMPPLSETAPGTPPEVISVVEWMLRKDVDQRFQSMEEVLMELEPVWRSIERSEVALLVEEGRALLQAGDVARAYETVRKALQMDTANIQAKDLLEQINADTRKNRTALPVSEKGPTGDETYIGPSTDSGRPPTSSIPGLTGSRAQTPTKSGTGSDTASRLRAATQRPATVTASPASAAAPTIPTVPAAAAGINWKKQMPVALVALAVIIGGATYFFGFRRPSESTAATNVPSAPISSSSSSAAPPSGLSTAPTESASGNAASDNRQPVTNGGVKPANFPDANASTRANPAPQQQTPKNQAAPVTNPPPSKGTEIAANIPVSAPSAQPSQPAAASAPPAAANPQPASQPATQPASQPAAATAPASAPAKAAETAPASQPTAAPAAAAPAAPVKSGQESIDGQAIALLLQQLSAAWAHKSLSEMDAIYPKDSERNNLKAVFKDAKSVSMEFRAPTINVTSDNTLATAIGSYDRKVVDGRGVTSAQSGNYYVRFSKKTGRWLIDEASY